MNKPSQDPIYNTIINGIKEDIRVAYDNQRFRAAVILIYAGIDAMAWLSMPATKTEVSRADFMRWTEKYIKFPCKEQVSGADLYGARCSMLHAYGVKSKMSRAGECRMIAYSDKALPEVVYRADITKDLVMVSVHGLMEAFFKGIDSFLVASFTDRAKAPIIEARLQEFVMMIPVKEV